MLGRGLKQVGTYRVPVSLDLLQAHTGQVKYTLPLAHLAEGPNDTDPPDYGSIGSGPQSTADNGYPKGVIEATVSPFPASRFPPFPPQGGLGGFFPQASEVSKSKQDTHPPLP